MKHSKRRLCWRRKVDEYEASALTQAVFAAPRGIRVKSVQRWRRRLRDEAAAMMLPAVVEVIAEPLPFPEVGATAHDIVLLVGEDGVLYVAPGTPTGYVAELVADPRPWGPRGLSGVLGARGSRAPQDDPEVGRGPLEVELLLPPIRRLEVQPPEEPHLVRVEDLGLRLLDGQHALEFQHGSPQGRCQCRGRVVTVISSTRLGLNNLRRSPSPPRTSRTARRE